RLEVADLYGEIVGAVRDAVLGPHMARVEEAEVDGVDVALDRLHEVAVLDELARSAALFEVRPDVGQGRRRLPWSHVGPDDAVALDTGIRFCLDLCLEIALGRLRRHIDALARDVELPAVIDAPQAVFLVAAKKERGAAMGAG